MATIHPTAIVDRHADLADDVEIRAYCIIKGAVTIGSGTVVHEQSHIHGHTIIGSRNQIGPAAWVGLDPQHRGYKGERTSLIIGDDNVIREGVSLHRSFKPSPEHATRIGHRNYFMGASHVGHDTVVGNDCTLGNGVLLAGHVTVADNVFLGGGAGFHQFIRIGRLCVVAGNEGVSRDVPPFSAVRYLGLKGFNLVGCRRFPLPPASIRAIRAAYHCYHTHRTIPTVIQAIRETCPLVPEVQELLDFLTSTKRGILPSVHFTRRSCAGDDD